MMMMMALWLQWPHLDHDDETLSYIMTNWLKQCHFDHDNDTLTSMMKLHYYDDTLFMVRHFDHDDDEILTMVALLWLWWRHFDTYEENLTMLMTLLQWWWDWPRWWHFGNDWLLWWHIILNYDNYDTFKIVMMTPWL